MQNVLRLRRVQFTKSGMFDILEKQLAETRDAALNGKELAFTSREHHINRHSFFLTTSMKRLLPSHSFHI